jgi:lipid II:glycine glycyltransferase (peptidoglycan interpeptide bridge formation enzyme)
MTAAGAETRANYLLKWEAIRSSREQGASVYDMWGLSHGGIAHFKAGFGGREVRYIGAYRLVLDRLATATIDGARRANTWLARRRHGLPALGPE